MGMELDREGAARNTAAKAWLCILAVAAVAGMSGKLMAEEAARPRARDLGINGGVLPTGPLNAITDVTGVAVGSVTRIEGDNTRTGVTAILPHGGNLYREKVPGAVFVGNGFGKLAGSTQVNELGEIESPILLTSTLNVPKVADAVIEYMLSMPGNEDVRSFNPLVGETNDARLNDIRARSITRDDVFSAIKKARSGSVEEGSVGAGTGTVAFGFKGGIGTSSRRLPDSLGGYTVGVLVQSNFGGVLRVAGAPVGQELGRYYLKEELDAAAKAGSSQTTRKSPHASCHPCTLSQDTAAGSIMIVIATDAPVDARNLRRMAFRSMLGLARTGASGGGDSGDYAIAFSTAPSLRISRSKSSAGQTQSTEKALPLSNDAMSPLFLAVVEATEEAIYNSLFRATTVTGSGRTAEALPIKPTVEILRKYRVTH
jgi:D-aminopeptidase